MKYVDEYRDATAARALAGRIAQRVTRPWTIMEICGGQTHSIIKFGLDELLPPSVSLVHGPGCPVCVTPVELIDAAVALAARPGVTVCSFGDMLRVPGTGADLLTARARGGDVRMVYSPLDAVAFAAQNPGREVVFFAVGFETTAPANGMAVLQARRLGLRNFSLLVSTCWCRPPSRPSYPPPTTACRGSSPPATSAPSWAPANTARSRRGSACRSSSLGSSRSTSSRACSGASSSSRPAARR
jgi:hydrogenase expression/formation protein HypD